MGFAEQMISSLKNNNRRKRIHIPFKNIEGTEKTSPLKSKRFTQIEKDILAKELKETRLLENEKRAYKVIITFALTAIVIISIVSVLKFIFF